MQYSLVFLALAALVSAKTDLDGCVSSEIVINYGASYLWYVPGTGEICSFLDCGGGRAPPATTVAGCPQYSGTATYSPDYIANFGVATVTSTTKSASTSGTSAPLTSMITSAASTTTTSTSSVQTSTSETGKDTAVETGSITESVTGLVTTQGTDSSSVSGSQSAVTTSTKSTSTTTSKASGTNSTTSATGSAITGNAAPTTRVSMISSGFVGALAAAFAILI